MKFQAITATLALVHAQTDYSTATFESLDAQWDGVGSSLIKCPDDNTACPTVSGDETQCGTITLMKIAPTDRITLGD